MWRWKKGSNSSSTQHREKFKNNDIQNTKWNRSILVMAFTSSEHRVQFTFMQCWRMAKRLTIDDQRKVNDRFEFIWIHFQSLFFQVLCLRWLFYCCRLPISCPISSNAPKKKDLIDSIVKTVRWDLIWGFSSIARIRADFGHRCCHRLSLVELLTWQSNR